MEPSRLRLVWCLEPAARPPLRRLFKRQTNLEGRDMQERLLVADVAQVYHLWNEYSAAMNAGDKERWLTLWVEDGIQMPPDAPRRVGKAEIRQGMEPQFDSYETSLMFIHTEEVRILGNQAYAHGTFEFELGPKGGEETKSYRGKFLGIMAKQVDGSWKIAIDCRNFDSPSG
jgi:uncharacterized protein (TIGR02246 family)